MTKLVVSLFCSLGLSASCFAHDTWLVPSSYTAQAGQPITFDLTSGMEFPKLDAAIKPERVHQARFRVSGEEGELKDFKPGEHALRVERAFKKEGIATLWVQLKPKDIELSDEDVAHYLEEIRADEEVQSAWAEQKGQTKWKELYTKCAKTFVAVGNSAADRAWAEPVGLVLELVPLTDPAALRVGQQAKFRLLRNAKPLAGAAVALHVEGDSGPRYETTNAEGVVTFPLESAGPSMLATVHLTPPATGKPWESEFSTVSFEVKGE